MFRLLVCLLLMAGQALADDVPTRSQTLDQDLQGPAIDWTAEILQRFSDGPDTCFLLRRTLSGHGYAIAGSEIFIACPSGAFDGSAFMPRNEVHVRGSLGKAMPRRFGAQVLNQSFVAAPFISPAPGRLLLPPGTMIVPAHPGPWPHYQPYGPWPQGPAWPYYRPWP